MVLIEHLRRDNDFQRSLFVSASTWCLRPPWIFLPASYKQLIGGSCPPLTLWLSMTAALGMAFFCIRRVLVPSDFDTQPQSLFGPRCQ